MFSHNPLVYVNAATRVIEAGAAFLLIVLPNLSDVTTAAFVVLIGVVSESIKTLFVRSQVTPVANPRTNDGFPLLPAVERVDSW